LRRAASLLVLALLLLLPVGLWWLLARPLPALDGVVVLNQLKSSVIVQYDGHGVPFIESPSEEDVYLAQGYLQARDRLFQMDMSRRLALGELSEVFGPASLPSDKLVRTIGFGRLARAELSKVSPGTLVGLKAFCRGINAYLAENSGKLPMEFTLLSYKPREWQPEDTIAILKYASYQSDDSWQLDELRQRVIDKAGDKVAGQLFAGYDGKAINFGQSAQAQATDSSKVSCLLKETRKILSLPRPTYGSTAFAIAGSRADHGSPLLAADKHSELTVPCEWWQCTMVAPGVKVAGAAIPGVPGVICGRNENIAWSSASLKADVQDLFIEEFSRQFANQYRVSSGWQTAEEIVEKIPVRFGSPYTHKVLVTQHGPVLSKTDNMAVALSWTGFNSDASSVDNIWKLNRASNWATFLEALDKFPGPPQVFIYCDRKNDLAYHAAGDVPVRTGGGQGAAITPGWQSTGQWLGKVQFNDMPWAYNPSIGYVVAANQKMLASRAVLLGNQWLPPYRANRVDSLLTYYQKLARKIGLPDMNQMQADVDAPLAQLVRQRLAEAYEETKVIDSYAVKALDVLNSWDGQLNQNSSAAAIYESFLYTAAKRLIEPKLSAKLTVEYLNRWPLWIGFVERTLKDKDTLYLPPEERTFSTFLVTTFSQSLSDLRVALRNDDPTKFRWQDVHKVKFEPLIGKGVQFMAPALNFAFSAGIPGVAGDSNTLNSFDVELASTKNNFDSRFNSTTGPTMRMLIDMSDDDKFYQSISLGQSGQMCSANMRDQLNPWLKVDPLPVAFSAKQAEKQGQHKIILVNHLEPVQH
jgi:penicillin G amidase